MPRTKGVLEILVSKEPVQEGCELKEFKMRKVIGLLLALTVFFIMSGAVLANQEYDVTYAVADIIPYEDGGPYGTALFIERDNTVLVAIRAHGLTNLLQGVHIHEFGDLSSPIASGAHFNPDGVTRGHPLQDEESHAADLLNLVVDEEGTGTMVMEKTNISLGPGPFSIIGRSVVIHAEEDPFIPEDVGGARVAGGVIELVDKELIEQGISTRNTNETNIRTIKVDMLNFHFDPSEIRAAPGEEIQFIIDNSSSAFHTFTVYHYQTEREEPFVNVSLSPGQQETVTVTMPNYETELYVVCLPHEGIEMTGSIVVVNP